MWYEDSDSINEEDAAIWGLEGLEFPIDPGDLLCGVALVKVDQSVSIADGGQDGLVIFIAFCNVN